MLEQLNLQFHDDRTPLVPSDEQPFPARLLVIDDDHLHRLTICRIAAKAGYVAAEAASFEEAARLVQEIAFDCIMLDASLGPHAGADLLRHLAAVRYKAPIIIVGGSDDATGNETMRIGRSLPLTIREMMPKPVDLTVLRKALDQVCARPETAPAF